VLAYDREVVAKAVEHLSQDHEAAQCMVVGTYGPHYPYAAPRELFDYYHGRVTLPATFGPGYRDAHPVHLHHFKKRDAETARKAMAAYYGMVEEIDGHVGQVKKAFDAYCARKGTEGIFIYMSDHGDLNGEHNQYGKMMFYEGSVRIPLIWCGPNIRKGARIETPASIMDIGLTLCDLVGAEPPAVQDGASLVSSLIEGGEDPDRFVLAEVIDRDGKNAVRPGRMIRKGRFKLFCYEGLPEHDRLYDLKADPGEKENLAAREKKVLGELKDLLRRGWDPATIAERHAMKAAHHRILNRWWTNHPFEQTERWRPPAGLERDFTRK